MQNIKDRWGSILTAALENEADIKQTSCEWIYSILLPTDRHSLKQTRLNV